MTDTRTLTFHDPDFLRCIRPGGITVWRCRADGGWGIGGNWAGVGRLHCHLPIYWRIGRWVAGSGKRVAFARIKILSAQSQIVTLENT